MARRKKSEIQIETEKIFENLAAEVDEKEIYQYVEENYLPFSWSVCLDRALTFTQDGLKPIQRKILYTAYVLGITDKSNKMKSSNFEGNVLRFSAHGGSYHAMTNIGESETPFQPRDIRVPLLRFKGFVGDLTNEPAASRYTEVNLFPAAMELISELSENCVDMVPNYNNTEEEPVFLPAKWPVAIINGVPDAMAVGFACNIPSHNPDEIMDATIALLKNPDMTNAEVRKIVKGPDFNCGCDIISCVPGSDGKDYDGVKSYLETGKGSFIMKAKYDLTEDNGSYIINFYALPYKVSPEKVIEAIKNKYEKGDFKELSSWKDLSDMKTPVNVEIKTKKGINISKVITDLYKKTPLQTSFTTNNTIIHENTPVKIGVKDTLLYYIEFRKQCVERKLNNRVEKLKIKLHLQEAIHSVLVDIDKCIKIIRNADTAEIACQQLMKTFKIDEDQANYILGLQLRKLTKSDSHEIEESIKKLKKEISDIESTLKNKNKFIDYIANEMEETKKKISSPRKCTIIKKEKEDELEDKEVYLGFKDDKIYRTFEKSDDVYKVNEDSTVAVITKDKAVIKSIYEIPDKSPVIMSRLGVNRALGVAANQGFLLLVGTEGALKFVDLNEIKLPKKDVSPILSQNVYEVHILDSIDKGNVVLAGGGSEKVVDFKDIPVQSLQARGKKFLNKPLEYVEINLK